MNVDIQDLLFTYYSKEYLVTQSQTDNGFCCSFNNIGIQQLLSQVQFYIFKQVTPQNWFKKIKKGCLFVKSFHNSNFHEAIFFFDKS